jgi:hypothetical protein
VADRQSGLLIPEGELPNDWREARDRVAAAFQMIESAFTGEERFERGLARLLDGIELDIERRRGGGSS